jgi:hypothetical protein
MLGKIRTKGAIRVWKSATDIALETGTARHELWQYNRWYHEIAYQLISI